MTNVMRGLSAPLDTLMQLSSVREVAMANSMTGILKFLLGKFQVERNGYSDTFTQLVMEYCVVGAVQQLTTLEYFLSVLVGQLKSEDNREVQASILREYFAMWGPWAQSLVALQGLQQPLQKVRDEINSNMPLDRSIHVEVQVLQRVCESSPIAPFLQLNNCGMGRDALVDTQDLFASLRSWEVPTHAALSVAYTTQRMNMVEQLLRASRSALQWTHQVLAFTVASGTDGVPVSCLGTCNPLYVNAQNPEFLAAVLRVFDKSAANPQMSAKFQESFKAASQLGRLLVVPNAGQVLVPRGLVGVLSGESQRSERTVDAAYKNLLSMLR